ncbi:MAG: hypothetical protein U9N63_05670 [Pseudomonadota bacterium]|nr:hypothetical protein [Pseudomonadota bacterium]
MRRFRPFSRCWEVEENHLSRGFRPWLNPVGGNGVKRTEAGGVMDKKGNRNKMTPKAINREKVRKIASSSDIFFSLSPRKNNRSILMFFRLSGFHCLRTLRNKELKYRPG